MSSAVIDARLCGEHGARIAELEKKDQDQEVRIRALERVYLKGLGIIIGAQFIGGLVIALLFK